MNISQITTEARKLLDDMAVSKWTNDQLNTAALLAMSEYAQVHPQLYKEIFETMGTSKRMTIGEEAYAYIDRINCLSTNEENIPFTTLQEPDSEMTLTIIFEKEYTNATFEVYYFRIYRDTAPEHWRTLIIGTMAYALYTRATSRSEANNLQDDTAETLLKIAKEYKRQFEEKLSALKKSPAQPTIANPQPHFKRPEF
jgi:hypothetical protein